MKCICGYENEDNYQKDKSKNFIQIDCLGKEFETNIKREYYPYGYYTGLLYACPKCGIVKLDIEEFDI